MVAYYARFVKNKTKKPKRGCKNAADGVQYGMFRIRPWRNWISQWIPIPKAGGSSPSGRAKKRGCRFCGILFFGPKGAEPPRNFAAQNAALFRESMRKQRQMAATGRCRSSPPPWRGIGGRRTPTQFCDAKCSAFPTRKHEKAEADGSNGKVPFKSHRGGPKKRMSLLRHPLF